MGSGLFTFGPARPRILEEVEVAIACSDKQREENVGLNAG